MALLGFFALATPAFAQTGGASSLPNPIVLVIVLGALSLAPFVVIMLTSFVKISVVLSILRNALGTQSVPPNQVITGLAFVLTIFIMVPVARQMYDTAGTVSNTRDIFSEASVKSLYDAGQKGKEPLRRFLSKHTHAPDRILFMELAARLDQSARPPQPSTPPATTPPPPGKEDFQILIPAFVTSELKEAFQIGFLVFVPFIIIDMVIANILLAMGMSMLSPSVISLPFKLLLFVLVDGWYMIVRGLVLSYV
ncbi:MAG: type III secretion system export apparatus subunit SctR [Bryobacteraceae bacterium]